MKVLLTLILVTTLWTLATCFKEFYNERYSAHGINYTDLDQTNGLHNIDYGYKVDDQAGAPSYGACVLGTDPSFTCNAATVTLKYLNDQFLTKEHFPSSVVEKLVIQQCHSLTAIRENAFHLLTNLNALKIQNTKLRNLPDVSQTPLVRLNLIGNEIELSTDTYSGWKLPNTLIRFALADNKIEWLPDGFIESDDLKLMSLSNNMFQNINSNIFGSLPMLEYLGLDGNRLTRIYRRTFEKITTDTFQHLNLSGNNLFYIEAGAFSHMPKLKILELHRNNLTTIEPGVIDSLGYLLHLDVHGNNIVHLTGKAFTNLPSLIEFRLHSQYPGLHTLRYNAWTNIGASLVVLFIGDNNITNFPHAVMEGDYFPNLETIYADHNPFQNTVGFSADAFPDNRVFWKLRNKMIATKTPFSAYPNLKYLYINNSTMTGFEGTDNCGMTSLVYLDLSNQHIITPRIPASTFSCLTGLQTLNISYNRLNSIPDCFQEAALPALTVLDLNYNYITILKESQLANLPALQTLHLDSNKILFIESGSFPQSLQVIYLRDNAELSLFNSAQFSNLPNLNRVELINGTSITSLPNDIFSNTDTMDSVVITDTKISEIYKGTFQSKPTLTTIDLTYNEITWIEDGTFADFTSLTLLDLSNNYIAHLPTGGSFANKYISTLDLQYNDLTLLPSNVFEHLTVDFLNLENGNTIAEIEPYALEGLRGSDFRVGPHLTRLHANSFSDVAVDNIHLENTRLRVLPEHAFYEVNVNDYIHLQNCGITSLENEVFYNSYADWIDLSGNNIKTLNFKLCGYFCHIREGIDLRENGLEYIAAEVFNDMYIAGYIYMDKNNFRSMPVIEADPYYLPRVSFEDNFIKDIHPGALNINSATDLVLSNNELYNIEPNSFDGLYWIEDLYLDNNNLRHLSPDLFADMYYLEELYLNGNELLYFNAEYLRGSVKLIHLENNQLESFGRWVFFYYSGADVHLQNNSLECECQFMNTIDQSNNNIYGTCASSDDANGVVLDSSLGTANYYMNVDASNFACSGEGTYAYSTSPTDITVYWYQPDYEAWNKYASSSAASGTALYEVTCISSSMDVIRQSKQSEIPGWGWDIVYFDQSHGVQPGTTYECAVTREQNGKVTAKSLMIAASTPGAYVTGSPTIRLVNGPNELEGRVEVVHENEWRGVCDDYFGTGSAKVVCRMLGFPTEGAEAVSKSVYGANSNGYWLDNVNCDGSETDIRDCSRNDWGDDDCGSSEMVGVICGGATIRLRNGPNEYEGRVEVFHDNEWRGVCDDYFGTDSAMVVCRMLGFQTDGAEGVGNSVYGANSNGFWLDNVDCDGTETDISDCPRNDWGNDDCSSSEMVGVICAEPFPSPYDFKRLPYILYDFDSNHVDFNNLYNIAPKTVNYKSNDYGAWLEDPNDSNFASWFQYDADWNVQLHLSPFLLQRTTLTEYRYFSNYFFPCDGLGFGHQNQQSIDHIYHNFGFTFIVNAKFDFAGTEIVTVGGGEAQWLFIDGIKMIDHIKGYDEIQHCFIIDLTEINAGFPVKITKAELQSSGDCSVVHEEYTLNLALEIGTRYSFELFHAETKTPYSQFLLNLNSMTFVEDGHYEYGNAWVETIERTISVQEDIEIGENVANFTLGDGVSNGPFTVTILSEIQKVYGNPNIRLRNGPNDYEGRVEVFHENEWRGVCDDSFGTGSAKVVCRMLGIQSEGAQAVSRSAYAANDNGFWLDDVACTGTETDISDCPRSDWGSHNCGANEMVGVICGGVTIRLRNGPNENEGRVEVFHDNEWRGVCDDYFGTGSAMVVCRMLGFQTDGAEAVDRSVYGASDNDFWLDNVNCDGTETDISDCPRNDWGNDDCSSSEMVGVICVTRRFTIADSPPVPTPNSDLPPFTELLDQDGNTLKFRECDNSNTEEPNVSNQKVFSISSSLAYLVIGGPLDYEKKQEFYIILSISEDSTGTVTFLSFKIIVEDVNDNCPVVSPLSSHSLFPAFDQGVLETLDGTDVDTGQGGQVSYAVMAGVAQANPSIEKNEIDREGDYYAAFTTLTFVIIALDNGIERYGTRLELDIELSNSCVLDVRYNLIDIRINIDPTTNEVTLTIPKYYLKEYECNDLAGMSNWRIQCNQITATSSLDSYINGPCRSRLNLQYDQVTGQAGAWSAAHSDSSPYITVDMEESYNFYEVHLQGRADADEWATDYVLWYWKDGGWAWYADPSGRWLLPGNTDRDTVVVIKLDPPIQTQWILIQPYYWHGHASLRMEFVGCTNEKHNMQFWCYGCESSYACPGDGTRNRCAVCEDGTTPCDKDPTEISYSYATECSSCPDGKICEDGFPLNCETNQYVHSDCSSGTCNRTCLPCEAGYTCLNGQHTPCLPGTYSDGNMVICERCSPGAYQELYGQSSCKSCPPGTYSENSGNKECRRCGHSLYSDGTKCVQCQDATECPCMGQGNCFDPTFCYNTGSGGFLCDPCPSGYLGDGINCTDIDECSENSPCFWGRCINTMPGYQCLECPGGYTGIYEDAYSWEKYRRVYEYGNLVLSNLSMQACFEIDECAVNNGGCDENRECINTVGGFYCGGCIEGFSDDPNNKTACYFYTDPCATGEHKCSPFADCITLGPDKYTCRCWTSYAGNGKYCGNDLDHDGFPDATLECIPEPECYKDNCRDIPNSLQEDSDGDSIGDWCDNDDDNDGLFDYLDNCRTMLNNDQIDTDGDGVGDVCDNCATPNTDQTDTDDDGIGDDCDDDDDNDGILDVSDNCPYVSNTDQLDGDGDSIGDVCDRCPESVPVGDNDICSPNKDNDGDSALDAYDNCPDHFNGDQSDIDGDGLGDVCDLDMDGDSIANVDDNCPYFSNSDQTDDNNDGVGDACATDSDGDGVEDKDDHCPHNPSINSVNFNEAEMIDVDEQIGILPTYKVKGTEILQTTPTSKPHMLIARQSYSDIEYEGTWYVSDNSAADYFGIVFGYKGYRDYYAALWMKTHKTVNFENEEPDWSTAVRGLQIRTIDSDYGTPNLDKAYALWKSGNIYKQGLTLWQEPEMIPWQHNTVYRWKLTYLPSRNEMQLQVYQGRDLIINTGSIYDTWLTGGRIGVMQYGEFEMKWTNIQVRCFDYGNTALYFDGIDDNVVLDDVTTLKMTKSFSIEVFVFIEDDYKMDYHPILCTVNEEICLWLDTLILHFRYGNSTLYANKTIIEDDWNHIIVRVDKNYLRSSLYVNAENCGSQEWLQAELNWTDPDTNWTVVLGKASFGHFHGYMDDVALFDRYLHWRSIAWQGRRVTSETPYTWHSTTLYMSMDKRHGETDTRTFGKLTSPNISFNGPTFVTSNSNLKKRYNKYEYDVQDYDEHFDSYASP